MINKVIDFTLTLILTFTFFVLTGIFIRYYTLQYDNIISFVVFGGLVFCHLKALKGKRSEQLILLYVCNFISINIVIRCIEGWKEGTLALPNVLFITLGMVSGYLIYKGTKAINYVIAALFFILSLCQAFIFHPYWHNYANYGSFTGRTSENLSELDWSFRTEDGKILHKSSYQNKIVLLDFWNTGCGVCFAKFPLLERMYKMYQGNSSVVIQAVNIPMERDTNGMAFNVIRKKNYSFPVVVGENNADSTWQIISYPTTIVFFNDRIVFRGNMEQAEDALNELLQKSKCSNPACNTIHCKNTGGVPLLFQKMESTCGCTVLDKKIDIPILPSKEDSIVGHLNTSQVSGVVERKIYVLANTKQQFHILRVKAYVEK